ncbi:pyrroline-5-carboxylate reductase [Williamsoniiplasma somnilux]|uniref:Pyrroline-5-carboxylate reductase n=1 Tax=Williamsoniiplasma somnilux TaxID=215578 RepID=A0A2K8NX52_9MOLU|nr:pyrroline-5-carboxylate reductase dimerization domain-containing protein [Williamsoniiplasma somnilux]ATZ18425.1 pyrroline-5-carboxylate reductase [Williamsoniiplasma somnilux]
MKILFIGLGHMGSALIKGINRENNEHQVYGYHYDDNKLKILAKELNIKPFNDLTKIKKQEFDVIFLGVRVPVMPEVIKNLDKNDLGKTIIISMASGYAIQKISSGFSNNKNLTIIRIMPNINANYQRSTTGITLIEDKKIETNIVKLLEKCGSVFLINEEEFSNFTIAAGCMPAYALTYVNEFQKAVIANGMDSQKAKEILIDTFIQTLESWKLTQNSAESIINAISVSGGVTIEALKVFKKNNLEKTIAEAYEAAIHKDKNH